MCETYLALLMMRKAWQDHRLIRDLKECNIFFVLIRDSLGYFVFVSSALAAAIVMFSTAPESALWTDLLIDTFGAIGGTRLIFSMVRAVGHPESNTTSTAMSGSIAITLAFAAQSGETTREDPEV
ncbi:hypothetical protein EXIGLDRAFT_777179 [Exidia glandulosa HHB12029]|uniref:Uncharacterized protein n=1 Tax=Exidia glandulosa HHB12029 TaxID=1314781 RepID=A0A165D5P3_EXIGL|nr:hypothetical protein EXIGLDRAFT_777179 [Exidia glandulosa HHB12029]